MNRIYLEYPYHIIAFFDLLEALLANEKEFFVSGWLSYGLGLAASSVMGCLDGFYTNLKNNIFLPKKAVKRFFTFYEGK